MGYESPAMWWCLRCVPEGLRDFQAPITEAESHGIPFICERCGAEMTPEKWEADEG